MAATTLTAIIRGLPGTYRERLSALTVERAADGRWCAILTYALAPVEPLHYTQSWEQVTCGGCRRANRELNS